MRKRIAILSLLLILIFLVWMWTGKMKRYSASEIRTMYGDDIDFASRVFGVPGARIFAMIQVESAGNKNARGLNGEHGLMQMRRIAFDEVGKFFSLGFSFDEMKADGRKQILAGAAYLRVLFDKFKNWNLATQAYNAGERRVRQDKNAGRTYLDKVLFYENKLKEKKQ